MGERKFQIHLHHNVVGDVVGVKRLQRAVAVRLVPVPSIIVKGVHITVCDGLIDPREDCLG